MSHTFFEPLPSDMQRRVLGHLSSEELFYTCCFTISKILRANAVLTLLSRRDWESLNYQKKFLAAWCDKPEHFTWIRGHESAITTTLRVLINDAVVKFNIRMLAMTVLACIQNPLSVSSDLDAKIAEARLSPLLPKLYSESPRESFEACQAIAAMAKRLPIMAIQTLLPTIMARFEDACGEVLFGDGDDDIPREAGKAFFALFKRLTEAQQESYFPQILALLDHKNWRVCQRTYYNLAGMAAYLPATIIQTLLPKIIARFEDVEDDIRSTACRAFLALFKRLSTKLQGSYLPQISLVLGHKDWQVREQACWSLNFIAGQLPTETIQALLPMLIAGLDDVYGDVRSAAYYAFFTLFKRLAPEQQKLHLPQISALLGHEEWLVREKACWSLAYIAGQLPTETIQALLPTIIALFEDKYSTATQKAFFALFTRLTPEQLGVRLPQMSALLGHKDWPVREQACQHLANIANRLPIETIQPLLPVTIARLNDEVGDVRNAAYDAFFTLFKRLPEAQQELHFRQIGAVLDHRDSSVRRQACWNLAHIADQLPTETIQALLSTIVARLNDEVGDVQRAAYDALFALFKKLAPEQQRPYLLQINALLDHKDRWFRLQACQLLANTAGRLPIETLQPLLPATIARLNDEVSDVRDAAYDAFSALLRSLPQEQRGPYIVHIMQLIQQEAASYRLLSRIADMLSMQHLQPFLPNLLAALEKNGRRGDACLTLKHYLSKLPKKPEDRAIRLWMCDALRPLLTAADQDTRKAALEIATFPGILELWNSGNLPTADYLECLYLQKMCELGSRLAAEPQSHRENAMVSGLLCP